MGPWWGASVCLFPLALPLLSGRAGSEGSGVLTKVCLLISGVGTGDPAVTSCLGLVCTKPGIPHPEPVPLLGSETVLLPQFGASL